MSGPGVDLLADDLVRIERDQPTHDSFGALASPPPVVHDAAQGPCVICRQQPARHACVNCERPVCGTHYWTMLGLCKECATPDEIQEARDGTHRPRPQLDIKWIED